MNRSRLKSLRALATIGVLVLSLVWLHNLGNGALHLPPLSAGSLLEWLERHDIAVVAFVIVRIIAIALAWYLLVLCVAASVAHSAHSVELTRIVERCTVGWARGLVGGMALFGVMAAPPQQPAPPASSDPLVELPPAGETATLTLLPDATPQPSSPEVVPAPVAVEPATTPDTWVVEHGDSFWSIARDVLTDAKGIAVTDRQVAAYWARVIDANRARLVNPRDADLLFAGQEIELPSVSPGT